MSALLNEWHANLDLTFSRQGPHKTVLAQRRHEGPLLVQKALYPEGPQVCHATILHPPSGIAGGDILSIAIKLDPNTHAALTTPGATRWYKANGRGARQSVTIELGANAALDWLPQENIVFEDADAHLRTHVAMQTGARAVGWEIVQLGSINHPEHWSRGRIFMHTELSLDGESIWLETGELLANSELRSSINGLAGFPSMATLWGFGPTPGTEKLESIARSLPWNDTLRAGVTCMPQANGQGLNLVRAVGHHVQDIRALFIEVWSRLRPALLGREASSLRLWRT